MPPKPVSDEALRGSVEAMRKYGSQKAAAKALGIPRQTLQSRLYLAGYKDPPKGDNDLLALVDSLRGELDQARQSLKDAVRPKFTIRQDNASKTGKIKALVIGDAHDSPLIDKARFEWMGKHARKLKPDLVIQIGDFATLDSLNSHVPNETYYGKAKPTFLADMASFNQALDAFGDCGAEKHCTLGNHERRLYQFEDNAPEAWGLMQHELQSVFERHKWTMSPYGAITYYGGVGFVHAALNRLGKTYGGKTAENTIANDSIHDLVIGHSHVERIQRSPKIGANNFVQVLNVGCALPDGHIEDYAQHALTGWSWGVMEITISGGHIQDRAWISMSRLGEMYG